MNLRESLVLSLAITICTAMWLITIPALAEEGEATSGLDKLFGKEKLVITDPARPFPVGYDVPGSAVEPASPSVTQISDQLAHSNDGPARPQPAFSSDRALDPAHWQTGTSLLAELAKAQGTRWVEPHLIFDQSGMRMSGVNGTYQFTGVQSKGSFSPPFNVRAVVMGTIANGNPLTFHIVSGDLRQSLRLEGNLNPHNRGYYGLWLTVGNANSVNLLRNVAVNQWYTLVVGVDSNGAGTVTIAGSDGLVLARKTDLPVGLGPFFVILGQREGAPFTVGPNEAVWSSAEVVSGSAAMAVQSDTRAVPSRGEQHVGVQGTGPSTIRDVDFQNFSYQSNCWKEVDSGFGKVIRVTGGSWKNGLEGADSLSFGVIKVFYGDVKGDGQVEAVVHTACLPPANWDYEELFVFEMSGGAPGLLTRLTPGEDIASHGPRYDVVRADGGELDVSYQANGEHGFGACPEWTVTERLRWNGNSFVSAGKSREKNTCLR